MKLHDDSTFPMPGRFLCLDTLYAILTTSIVRFPARHVPLVCIKTKGFCSSGFYIAEASLELSPSWSLDGGIVT